MTLLLNQSLLLESKSFRTEAITNFSDDKAIDILAKAKAIIFAVWGGSGWATTAQIAEYFGTTESSVRELFRVNGAEFRDWETKTLTGKDLRDARQTLCLPSRTSQARVFSALGTLRIAMLLTESEIAAQVRTIILDLVSSVPAIVPQQPTTPVLPPVEQRLHTFVQAMKTLAELTGGRLNPYMEQNCKDFAANLIADYNRQLLTGTQEKWLGVVNFAESELGKKVPLKGPHYRGHLARISHKLQAFDGAEGQRGGGAGERLLSFPPCSPAPLLPCSPTQGFERCGEKSGLGTWVRTFYPQLGSRQETRLVNGVQQPVYVYACHEPTVVAGLTKAIEEFFAHPSPGAALRQAGAFARKSLVTA